MNRVRRSALGLGAVLLGVTWAALASAQHTGDTGSADFPPADQHVREIFPADT